MKFNYKSKKGFTLIELLVVIGILAVLAAIAIPSVAGLIDRANVSADKTNATEMTNAVERFTSEYELYVQDIASGTVNVSSLDDSQNRVYQVTECLTRKDISNFESSKGVYGKGININTKYPVNEETFKAVVKTYMKASSSTFEPKQSDKAFYYSPELGIIIVAKEGTASNKLTESVKTESAYYLNNNKLEDGETQSNVQWLNVTMNELFKSEGKSLTNYIVAEGKNTYTKLKNDVEIPPEKTIQDAGSFDDSGNYNKITVNGETVNATIDNMVKGNYLSLVNGVLDKDKNSNNLSGTLVIDNSVKEIAGYLYPDVGLFQGSNISKVVINEGVEKLGSQVFCGCSKLTSVYIPSTVSSIDVRTFLSSNNITDFKVSENNPYFATYDNSLYTKNLSKIIKYNPSKQGNTIINFPTQVKSIGEYSFSHALMQSITIPEGVTTIAGTAFESANSITCISLPSTLKSIYGQSLWWMNNLQSLSISNENNYFNIIDGKYLVNKDGNKLIYACSGLTDVYIPYGVQTLDSYSISSKIVENIYMPSSVTKVNSGTVYSSNKLINIFYSGNESSYKNILIDHTVNNNVDSNIKLVDATKHYNQIW